MIYNDERRLILNATLYTRGERVTDAAHLEYLQSHGYELEHAPEPTPEPELAPEPAPKPAPKPHRPRSRS